MTVLIIGAGLSGLALAEALEAQGEDYLLLEARPRFGGRIKTEHHESGYFDMGPAWFWQGQPRIDALINRLGLKKFNQFASGDMTYEDAQGHVQLVLGFSPMQGALRLHGGLEALTQSLADRLPEKRKRLNTAVTKLTRADAGVSAQLSTGDTVEATQAVLAMPPRIAANITFDPPLPQAALKAMHNTPTWMAGHAKAVAVYETPFWRDDGRSGDAQSRLGPMVQIHDASPAQNGPYAFFGFIGVPPNGRTNQQKLRAQIKDQLVRLFGPKAANLQQLYVQDWAFDNNTATAADLAPQYTHPTYGMPPELLHLWDDQLHFSGTEVASEFGGYLEGALEAAENVLKVLKIRTGEHNANN